MELDNKVNAFVEVQGSQQKDELTKYNEMIAEYIQKPWKVQFVKGVQP